MNNKIEIILDHDGSICFTCPIFNGKKHGKSFAFHFDDIKANESEYKFGILDGLSKSWCVDGCLMSASKLKRGIYHGASFYFNDYEN